MVFGRDKRVGEFFSILRNGKINKGSGKLQVRICLVGIIELEVTNIGKYVPMDLIALQTSDCPVELCNLKLAFATV